MVALLKCCWNRHSVDGPLRRTLVRVRGDEDLFLETAYLLISLSWCSSSPGNASQSVWNMAKVGAVPRFARRDQRVV